MLHCWWFFVPKQDVLVNSSAVHLFGEIPVQPIRTLFLTDDNNGHPRFNADCLRMTKGAGFPAPLSGVPWYCGPAGATAVLITACRFARWSSDPTQS